MEEDNGVKCYSGTGAFAAARGDGIIPFPAKYVLGDFVGWLCIRARFLFSLSFLALSEGAVVVISVAAADRTCAVSTMAFFLSNCVMILLLLCHRTIMEGLGVEHRGEYDETFEEGRMVKKFDEHVRVSLLALRIACFHWRLPVFDTLLL